MSPSQMFVGGGPHRWAREIKGLPAILDKAGDLFDDSEMPGEVRREAVELLKAHNVDEDVVFEVENAETVGEFDDALDALYNWADRERVWIDPTGGA